MAASGVFWRGNRTARVPFSMYAEHRGKLCAEMAAAHAAASAAADADSTVAPPPPLGVALLQGGVQQTRHDTDHEELFRQARERVSASALRVRFSRAHTKALTHADVALSRASARAPAATGVLFRVHVRRR
jgi:hypothetical protein